MNKLRRVYPGVAKGYAGHSRSLSVGGYILLTVLLAMGAETAQASKTAPKVANKSGSQTKTQNAPGEGYKSPVTGLTRAQKYTQKLNAKKAAEKAQAESLVVENNQPNLVMNAAPQSITLAPLAPRIRQTIQQQRAAQQTAGLEIGAPGATKAEPIGEITILPTPKQAKKVSFAEKIEYVEPTIINEVAQPIAEPTPSVSRSSSPTSYPKLNQTTGREAYIIAQQMRNQKILNQEIQNFKPKTQSNSPTSVTEPVEAVQPTKPVKPIEQKLEEAKINREGLEARLATVKEKRLLRETAEKTAQDGQLKLTAENLKNLDDAQSVASTVSDITQLSQSDLQAQQIKSAQAKKAPANKNNSSWLSSWFSPSKPKEKKVNTNLKNPETEAALPDYNVINYRTGDAPKEQIQLTQEDMINETVNNKAGKRAERDQKRKEAQQQKIKNIEKIQAEVAKLQSSLASDTPMSKYKNANEMNKVETIRLLKQNNTSDLIRLYISAPVKSGEGKPVNRTLAWNAITSKIADATGITRLVKAFGNSSIGKALNKRIENINNRASQTISNKNTQADVTQVVSETSQQYAEVATAYNPLLKDMGVIKNIDVTVTPEPAENIGTLSKSSSISSELSDVENYNNSSSGKTSRNTSQSGSPDLYGLPQIQKYKVQTRPKTQKEITEFENDYGQFVDIGL